MKLSAPIFKLKHRAKTIARDTNIPLNEALNLVARNEGFPSWSALSSHVARLSLSAKLLTTLKNGDLLLLAGHPGEGKTTLALQLLLEAAREGRRAALFTLEYTSDEARRHLRALSKEDVKVAEAVEIATSNDISADYIVANLSNAMSGTVAVIDYLQLLDQQRTKQTLDHQVKQLAEFAKKSGITFGFISQVDRTFDDTTKKIPDVSDIRLPNQVDLKLFNKACFVHDGEAQLHTLT